MKLKLHVFLSLLLTLLASCVMLQLPEAAAIDRLEVTSKDRVIYLTGIIQVDGVSIANRLMTLAGTDKDKTIDIVINSPGGVIIFGDMIIAAMNAVKSRGIKIRCVTTVLAASMAYSIYNECSERYALSSALFLFHPSRVMLQQGSMRADEASETAINLAEEDTRTIKRLQEKMHMDEAIFLAAFDKEKLWRAEDLQQACARGYLTIVTDIVGIDNPFSFMRFK